LNDKLTLNTGVHANYFALSKSWSIEPRLGLNWRVAADQTISLGLVYITDWSPWFYYFAKSSDQTSLEPNKLFRQRNLLRLLLAMKRTQAEHSGLRQNSLSASL
jgi:hypothetical protein